MKISVLYLCIVVNPRAAVIVMWAAKNTIKITVQSLLKESVLFSKPALFFTKLAILYSDLKR